MFFIALSSLQNRYQQNAYEEIVSLNPDGIQLTPGNKVDPNWNFQENIKIPYRLHHSFGWNVYKANLYTSEFSPNNIGENHSIHPPFRKSELNFNQWLTDLAPHIILEVMYPEYYISNDEEINAILSDKRPIALDISHLYILQCQNAISNKTLNNLLNYDNIEEVHISHNRGVKDTHQPIKKDTPFLDWVKERKDIKNFVYESYFHRLSQKERLDQINFVKGILE